MANQVHAEYFIYGSAGQIAALDAEIASAYEKIGRSRDSSVFAESLLKLLGVEQPVDGAILSVSSAKSHGLERGILIDTELRWSHTLMNEAIKKLVNVRPGLKFAYRAMDDFMDVYDPERVFFRRPKTEGAVFTLRGEYDSRAIDETFSDEEDLLDFVRDSLELGVRDIDELLMALDCSGVTLNDSRSNSRVGSSESGDETGNSYREVPGRSLDRYEAALVRLGKLVEGVDLKPSTMANLRDYVYELDPDLAPTLEAISFWSKQYYGMTPAKLLRSRGILVSGGARKAGF